jgi:hypothetical protein
MSMEIVTNSEAVKVESNTQSIYRLIPSPHMLVLATNERRVSALVATSGSHWLK